MNPKKELVSVRIPEALNKRLAKHVEPMGISKNAFILSLINKELERVTRLDNRQSAQATPA